MRISQDLRRTALASALAIACTAPYAALADDITVASGTTKSTGETVGGTDHLSVASGASWVADDTVIKWKNASTALVIDNDGLIESTEDDGRAINASGDDTTPRYLTLNNNAGATIRSQSDAFRINIDVTGGAIVVNNAGTIISTVDGQALDFDAIDSAGTAAASVTINNLTGGLIQANGADAIRPGQGGTVYNAGTIYSDGIIGDSNDGIDFQAHSGSVTNLTGGVISGQRHGITSDTNVDVYNAAGATITGRNGSGVGSDGTGSIVNYGTITGAYVGTGNGDGDGVDIDGYGTVDNWGTIQGTGAAGTGKDGETNVSEGIVITGGGIINNHVGGLVTGLFHGVTAFGNFSITNDGQINGGTSGLFIAGNTTLTNTGLIQSDNEAVSYGAGGDATLVNSGTIRGGTYAIHFVGGNDTLVIDTGSSITGLVDGGDGHDTLWLRGGSFDTAQNFESLQVTGTATLSGDNLFQNVLIDGQLQLGTGGASGSWGPTTVDVTDNGKVSIDRSDTFTLGNAITGTGGLRQIGSGTTILTGINTYAGPTSVEQGRLYVGDGGSGSIAGDAVATAGGTLGGTGALGGNVLIQTGGTLAPGGLSAAGQMTVVGNVTFEPGARYYLAGAGDGVQASGYVTIGDGSRVLINDNSMMTIGTPFQILTATGGINGRFESATVAGIDLPFLTPSLSYTANSVGLTLSRNDVALNTVASTHDERTTANALDTLDVTSALASSVLTMNASGVRAALDELSGEQFASTRTAIVNGAFVVRDAVNRHLLGEDNLSGEGRAAERDGLTAWTAAWGSSGDNARGNASRLTTQGTGLLVGADTAIGDGRVGALAGRGTDHDDVDALNSSAHMRTTYLGLYAGTAWDAWRLRGGVTYANQDIDTNRRLSTIATGERLTSRYDGQLAQAFAEGGYRFTIGSRQWLEPFAGAERIHLHTRGASEGDALGALDVDAGSTSINAFTLGVHQGIELGSTGRLEAHASVAWRRATGDLDAESVQRFAGSDASFAVRGVPIAREATAVEAGLSYRVSARTSLGGFYSGQFAQQAKEQALRLQLNITL